ncbi:biotin-dependent carboxyltransferase family protein [Paenibacillus bovis]|uniref:Urea amidolyase n=1 Tax=Paenibacillus bovis TaxID=1616788 RepID=A0A172ZGW2_9BACL|nr:biotin-dependent carboxyltransferase family protein [Paenibacillus bovis]ANF96769.1 urea amidolyase [Paenibacillus bovis]
MSIIVEKLGLLTTIQDIGRTGYGRDGVSITGAMDRPAHVIANWLVGNTGHEPALEITLAGFVAEFTADCWIAVTGGQLTPMIDGQLLPMWRPVYVRQGSRLSFKKVESGCRAYLAVAGGWDVPSVMGSASTYLRAGIGGYRGRALREGDLLGTSTEHCMLPELSDELDRDSSLYAVPWQVSPLLLPSQTGKPVIRILPGRQWEDFTAASRHSLLEESYRVTPQSDRMGYRLSGSALELESSQEYLSEAVTHGTIQVPADGQPIVLMSDRQTLGGYAKIAQVISLDLPVMAQLAPGDYIRFEKVSIAEAQQWYGTWVRELRVLRKMIEQKLKELH